MKPISALIRTWNSERTLERTFVSLQQQEPAIDEYIVVDSGSTDGTLTIAQQYGAKILRYPEGEAFNYSRALNIGMAAVRNDLVLIISSHVELLYPDVVRLMARYLEEFSAAGSYCTFTKAERVNKEASDLARGKLVSVIFKGNFDGHNGLWNALSLVAKSAWREHPFSEDIPRAEDQEWAQWQYLHASKPTVQIRNAGATYNNPYTNVKKDALDYAVIAHRLMPSMATWPAIFRLGLSATWAGLRGRTDVASRLYLCAWETARAHFDTSHWHALGHMKSNAGGMAPTVCSRKDRA
ncbi:MAG: glycosyltransferase family 2 protein [Chromatiales bacterium]|nr:glycosyltransferase family 2 protein [Chromatiales bacterium]